MGASPLLVQGVTRIPVLHPAVKADEDEEAGEHLNGGAEGGAAGR